MAEETKQSRIRKIALKVSRLFNKKLPSDTARKLSPEKQKELDKRLLKAAEKGDISKISRLLNAGAQVCGREWRRLGNDNPDIVEFVLNTEANIQKERSTMQLMRLFGKGHDEFRSKFNECIKS